MRRFVYIACVLALGLPAMASALVRSYALDPVRASWAGKARPDLGVSQSITCNFDSLSYVELFVGAKGAGGAYAVAVLEDGDPVMTSDGNRVPDHDWVRFDQWPDTVAFTKGKLLTVKFTRSGQDSVNYYYQGGNPYQFGHMRVGGTDETGKDLCCRVYSRLNATDSTYWGVEPMLPWHEPELRGTWVARAESARVGAVRYTFDRSWIQESVGVFHSDVMRIGKQWLQDGAGCDVHVPLIYTPTWASTRFDSLETDSIVGQDTFYGDTCWSIYSAPCSLWANPASGHNNWVNYLKAVLDTVDAAGCDFHTWEVWNEPCDTHPAPPETLNVTGWWRRPNARDYQDSTTFGGLHGMTLLYMRMAWLTDSVIHEIDGHEDDRILIGSVIAVNRDAGPGAVLGKDWLRKCYEVAGEAGWTRKPTGISVHPYHNAGRSGQSGGFDAVEYEEISDTLRAIMRENDNADAPLWNTEVGWDTIGHDTNRNANSLVETFVSSKASEALPQGGYDRTYWWLFRESHIPSGESCCGHFPLWNSTMT